jgi:hypothetical protein
MSAALLQNSTSELMTVSTRQQKNDAVQTAARTIPALVYMLNHIFVQNLQVSSCQVADVNIAVLAAARTPLLLQCSPLEQCTSLSSSEWRTKVRHNGYYKGMLPVAPAGAAGAQLATCQQQRCCRSKQQQQQQQEPAKLHSAATPHKFQCYHHTSKQHKQHLWRQQQQQQQWPQIG